MQRKALKQLNKVTQWTNEKVFSSEKTQFSEDFGEFEKEIEPLRKGIERLHATSVPFFEQLTKHKPSADPYRPSGSKDKMSATEALGLVMIDYGNDAGGEYGDGLVLYGRARCKLAIEEFGERLNDGYIQATEAALAAVNDYKLYRKKMDSRRLTLDASLSRLRSSKKESPALEQEVEHAQLRLEEAEEETKLRMMAIKEQEAAQFESLADLVDAELEYFTRCQEILLELRNNFPKGYSAPKAREIPTRERETPRETSRDAPSRTRARAKSNASARSAGRAAGGGFSGSPDSDEDEPASRASKPKSGNRSRSDSAASAGGKPNKGKSLMSSIGSTFAKSKSSFRKKDGEALMSEEDESPKESPSRPATNRARSQSVVSVVTGLSAPDATPRRRAITSPSSPAASYVKVLYDFEAFESDELPLRVGQIIEIKSEVSSDWAIGECEGMSGLFPRAYTEEYIPTPVAPPVAKRNLPPPVGGGRRLSSPSEVSLQTDEETDAESIQDNDDSTALATAAQPPPMNRNRVSSIKKAAPPPPPPSRRSTLAGTRSPPPPTRSRSSTITRANSGLAGDASPFRNNDAQSPFAHSDDEGAGLSRSLGNMGMQARGGNGHADAGSCGICGCSDFTQNVFKSAGTCSTCFHQH